MPRTKNFDRQEVLNRAVHLFWTKGFHATSIQDLVDHLGINRASMYDTFGSKEQLFQEALALYQQQSRQPFDNIEKLLGQKSVRDFMTTFFLNELKDLKKDIACKGCFVVNTTAELANQSEPIYKFVYDNMANFIQLFTKIFKIGQERGEIKKGKSSETLAKHFFTFFSGWKVTSKIEKDPQILQEIVKVELDFIFE